ncbi:HlyD family secretion protein [Sanyastnella coralliicola]|uniref:HlyD family secretion protein n=1 Tax=Sanyastnella coralliicola TaxID=3069118 RepID=UPI0027B9D266|nr:HlyD family efflux transporter periplasmic adaptor subunit [Longitalea sp. SCSIO 12813]
MLNISPNTTPEREKYLHSKSLERLEGKGEQTKFLRMLGISFGILVILMLLPWTQNLNAPGEVISRFPDKKPQQVNSLIDGRIKKWYAFEGQNINAGDTIVTLTEVKPEYLDEDLIPRTLALVRAKEEAIVLYTNKLEALANQEVILEERRELAIQQAKLKIQQSIQKVAADSAAAVQARIDRDIANEREKRAYQLFEDGLITQTDLESRILKKQEAQAKFVKAENTLNTTRQELSVARLDVRSKRAEYNDKIAKNQSDQASTGAAKQDAIAEKTKLENTLANYRTRQTGQVILAPQGGRVVSTTQGGVGEIIKAGASVCTIQPLDFQEAAELYVNAMDVPLIHPGENVRLQFDGWPALVFSGWPSASVGTFGGQVVSVDQVINAKGKYRVIIIPEEGESWPRPLSIGSGVYGMVLLKDVPLGYELWRQINGFPPEFYEGKDVEEKKEGDEKK